MGTVKMANLEFLGICLHKPLNNRRHEVDGSFLAHLTAHHQLVKREIGRYSIETPVKQPAKPVRTLSPFTLQTALFEGPDKPTCRNGTFLKHGINVGQMLFQTGSRVKYK